MAPARALDVAPESSPLERVLPVMLQSKHLSSGERLACFQTSKGTSDAVLRHAACTHLVLSVGPATPAGGSSRRSARAHAAAAQELAARSHNVTLTLRGGLLTPAACLQQRITTIELHDMRLDQQSSAHLRLHMLPRLHTLILVRCRMVINRNGSSSSSNKRQSSQKYRSSSVRTLVWSTEPNSDFPADFLQLVDLSQLQKLTIDSTSITSHLPRLPALLELHVVGQPGDDMFSELFVPSNWYVNDEGWQSLLAHPRLKHVSLPRISTRSPHMDAACAWESLHLLAGVDVMDLANLPLAGIKSCIVHGSLTTYAPDPEDLIKVDAAVGRVSHASNVVFQADRANVACNWLPAEPSFALELDFENPEVCAGTITMTMQHLAPGTAFVIRELETVDAPEVLNSLAKTPTTVTTLCFSEAVFVRFFNNEDFELPGVLVYLPSHVSHVVLEMPQDVETPLSQEVLSDVLVPFVGGLWHPLRLTLLVRDLGPWEALGQGVIESWLATVASGDVQLQLQLVEDDHDDYY